MTTPSPTALPPRVSAPPCPDRVEVNAEDRMVTAKTVQAWLDHLRTHGWTDKDLSPVWLLRARTGVTR